MTDPLDALRAPITPADPDPAFAARLRARLERALDLPEGVAVTETTLTLAEREPSAPAEDRGAAIPYLAVRGARVPWTGMRECSARGRAVSPSSCRAGEWATPSWNWRTG